MTTAEERGFRVRALGEIAIRCRDIATMTAFYRDIIGLEAMQGPHRADIVFLRVAEGYAGHTAVLALFPAEGGPGERRSEGDPSSSLHHIALTVGRAEQDRAVEWFALKGVTCTLEEFTWIGWRGVFVRDPEGNTVELVAYDPALAGREAKR